MYTRKLLSSIQRKSLRDDEEAFLRALLHRARVPSRVPKARKYFSNSDSQTRVKRDHGAAPTDGCTSLLCESGRAWVRARTRIFSRKYAKKRERIKSREIREKDKSIFLCLFRVRFSFHVPRTRYPRAAAYLSKGIYFYIEIRPAF